MSEGQFSALYDELPLWSAPFGLRLLEMLRMRPGLCVLDVGSGTGFPLLEIAQRLGASCSIFGIDPWKEATELIAWKCRQRNQNNAYIVRGVAEELPFPSEFFDLITSNNGLNNTRDFTKALAECRRVARAGAQVVLTQNLPGTMIEFYSIMKQCCLDRGLDDVIAGIDAHIFSKRLPLGILYDLVMNAGFAIEEMKEDVFNLRFLDASAFFNNWLIRKGFLPSWSELFPAAHREALLQDVMERLDVLASEAGELKFAVPFVCMSCVKAN